MERIIIHSKYITLGQFLKYISIISAGGEAKHFLSNNTILINKNVENRRGKKLFAGDKIEILGKKYLICDENEGK